MWAGLAFETRTTGRRSAPDRTDVAAFVGFASLKPGPVPTPVVDVWQRMGWLDQGISLDDGPSVRLPVLLDSEAEARAWLDGQVNASSGLAWEGYLLGAIRDFFRQGGRRCWVVPVGPPLEPPTDQAGVEAALDEIVPGLHGGAEAVSSDRQTWRGLAQLWALPDVALLAVPDLPGVVGAPPSAEPTIDPEPLVVTQFVECTTPGPEVPGAVMHRAGPPRFRAPSVATDWTNWQGALRAIASWLQSHRPDVQLLAALPLAERGSAQDLDPLSPLLADGRLDPMDAGGVATAWLQLAYPWLRTDTSADRLGGLAPPDGVLAGLLARNALARGTFRPASREVPQGVWDLEPRLGRLAVWQARPDPSSARQLALHERVCLIGRTPSGLQLLSDVTPTADANWTSGAVNRLVGVIRRLVLRVGLSVLFATNGPQTWARVRRQLEAVLGAIQQQGGLHPVGGFAVRCGPDTMTQQDLDAGRLIAEVDFLPLQAIRQITVVLSQTGSGPSTVQIRGGA
ncbi:MAG: hypothetical protein KTR31_04460 [Myxococcales bacterium]|nr:hypothetical protein [Myxococcales bacterium]